MTNWRVYKDHEDRWLRWIAIPAHETWWEEPQGRRFPEWGMAVHYANRMSRNAKPEPIVKPTEPDALAKALDALGYKRTRA